MNKHNGVVETLDHILSPWASSNGWDYQRRPFIKWRLTPDNEFKDRPDIWIEHKNDKNEPCQVSVYLVRPVYAGRVYLSHSWVTRLITIDPDSKTLECWGRDSTGWALQVDPANINLGLPNHVFSLEYLLRERHSALVRILNDD